MLVHLFRTMYRKLHKEMKMKFNVGGIDEGLVKEAEKEVLTLT